MLHYNPRHVSSSTMLIFRRTNCIITAFFQWESSYSARHEEANSSFQQLGFYKPKTGQDIRALEVAMD